MSLDDLISELVTANRILANEGVVDAFGHISVRHPNEPHRFFLSRARAPELIDVNDIISHAVIGSSTIDDDRKPYLERFIHGSIYKARPDVQAVVHSHSRSVVPFSISKTPLRPVVHSSACIGHEVPVWDMQSDFGDTDLLVSSVAMGDSLARAFGQRHRAVLMRGHGSTAVGTSIRGVVYNAIYLMVNAQLQASAMSLGDVTYLSSGEIEKINARLERGRQGEGYGRAWDYWKRRVESGMDH